VEKKHVFLFYYCYVYLAYVLTVFIFQRFCYKKTIAKNSTRNHFEWYGVSFATMLSAFHTYVLSRPSVHRAKMRTDMSIAAIVLSPFSTEVKYRWIFTAHRRKHASDALPLPVRRRWSPLASSFSQAFSKHCEVTDTG